MKIIFISDTHLRHDELNIPDGDILVHCGDFTNSGTIVQINSFMNWFSDLPHENKIIVAGNHELGLDVNQPSYGFAHTIFKSYLYSGVHYLQNESLEINGVKFYGSPENLEYNNWAFNRKEEEIGYYWDKIPDDTQVLLTHSPPYGILDKTECSITHEDISIGCKDLLLRTRNLKNLKIHAFGHAHLFGGKVYESGGIKYINAAMCDESYKITRSPVCIDI